jgi:putative lipoprotein
MQALIARLVLILALAACAPIDTQASPPLAGTSWTLTLMDGWTPADPKRTPTLSFADGRVSGYGGCNRFTGGYELKGATIRFSNMATTLMACEGGMDVEGAFHRMLGRVRTAEATATTLTFKDETGATVAAFARAEQR